MFINCNIRRIVRKRKNVTFTLEINQDKQKMAAIYLNGQQYKINSSNFHKFLVTLFAPYAKLFSGLVSIVLSYTCHTFLSSQSTLNLISKYASQHKPSDFSYLFCISMESRYTQANSEICKNFSNLSLVRNEKIAPKRFSQTSDQSQSDHGELQVPHKKKEHRIP